MRASVPGFSFQLPPYRGSSQPWHASWRRLAPAACHLAIALCAGGCSFSYQLDDLFSKKNGDLGSLRGGAATTAAAEPPAEGDLAFARAAAREVLTKGGQDSSVPWENPQTGARGTITPLASAYSQDGLTCRDFLASYIRKGNESWLQGEACRAGRGKWEVRTLRPWRKT